MQSNYFVPNPNNLRICYNQYLQTPNDTSDNTEIREGCQKKQTTNKEQRKGCGGLRMLQRGRKKGGSEIGVRLTSSFNEKTDAHRHRQRHSVNFLVLVFHMFALLEITQFCLCSFVRTCVCVCETSILFSTV
jgi:hypothetical protein